MSHPCDVLNVLNAARPCFVFRPVESGRCVNNHFCAASLAAHVAPLPDARRRQPFDVGPSHRADLPSSPSPQAIFTRPAATFGMLLEEILECALSRSFVRDCLAQRSTPVPHRSRRSQSDIDHGTRPRSACRIHQNCVPGAVCSTVTFILPCWPLRQCLVVLQPTQAMHLFSRHCDIRIDPLRQDAECHGCMGDVYYVVEAMSVRVADGSRQVPDV